MECISDLSEVSYKSSFKWRINNLSKTNRPFTIKSKEFSVHEAKASWFLRAQQVALFTDGSKFLELELCVCSNELSEVYDDENAVYNFIVELKNGQDDLERFESGPIFRDNSVNYLLIRHNLSDYVTIGKCDDSILLEATFLIETLSCETRMRRKTDQHNGANQAIETDQHIEVQQRDFFVISAQDLATKETENEEFIRDLTSFFDSFEMSDQEEEEKAEHDSVIDQEDAPSISEVSSTTERLVNIRFNRGFNTKRLKNHLKTKMECINNLSEVSFESSFKWRINNLLKTNKAFIIKSKAFSVNETNASWYLKAKQLVFSAGEKLLELKLCVRSDNLNEVYDDENAVFKFSVEVGNGRKIESGPIVRDTSVKYLLIEHTLSQYVTIGKDDDSILLQPTLVIETLSYESQTDQQEDNPASLETDQQNEAEQAVETDQQNIAQQEDFVVVSAQDLVTKETEKNEKEEASEEDNSEEDSDDSDESDQEEEEEEEEEGEENEQLEKERTPQVKESVIAQAKAQSNESADVKRVECVLASERKVVLTLNQRIENIYLTKMRQVAAVSAHVLVEGSKNTDGENSALCDEACDSFGAQLTKENWVEIYYIAKELGLRKLTEKVFNYHRTNIA